MPLDELLQTKREDILQMAHKYGAYNVRVFGSVARGEAIDSMPQMFRSLHTEIQWKKYTDMRDALSFRYYDIKQDHVWAMVENDIPPLKASVDAILTGQE